MAVACPMVPIAIVAGGDSSIPSTEHGLVFGRSAGSALIAALPFRYARLPDGS